MVELTDIYRRLYGAGVLLFNHPISFGNQSTKATGISLCDDGTYGIFIDFSRIESLCNQTTYLRNAG